MRIQLASDLHLEQFATQFPGELLISPAPGADALVLAGDISNGSRAVRMFADWPVPVIYVAGNHEAFDGHLETVIRDLATESEGTAVRFLEQQSFILGTVRFLGCTLWTDCSLYGADATSRAKAQADADRLLMDRHVITTGEGVPFSAERAEEEHKRARGWLDAALSEPFDGKTVVVTHHATHPQSINEKYVGHPANPGFVSHLTPLLRKAQFWFHGHCHDNSDYWIGDCHVVANPRGYALNRRNADSRDSLIFENSRFICSYIIDTDAGR
ncbi:metallophosphoesterase [Cupriavidus basilensis]